MSWLDLKKPIIALAPMADMTDSPFCRVCREVTQGVILSEGRRPESKDPMRQSRGFFANAQNDGTISFVIFREMVSAEAIVRGNEKTMKMCEFEKIEKPIVLQLFGGKSEVIVEAAKILVQKQKGIFGIDINMGCPVPKIANKAAAGASLMKDPERAIAIVKALKNANLGVPISVKTRLGWSKNTEILDFAPQLEQAGADAITIHGRTKKQGYSGSADWEMIGRVKKLLKIPVIANGDINTPEDIKKCLEITGSDGVMIGRGALGNPWIFSSVIARSVSDEAIPVKQGIATLSEVARNDIKKVVLRHAELHLEHYGEEYGLKTFRKHLLCYFKNIPGAKELRVKLVKVNTMEELSVILSEVRTK